MSSLEKGREIASGAKADVETVRVLLEFSKNLMTKFRAKWSAPVESIYSRSPNNWLEELLFVAIRMIKCFIKDPSLFLETDLPDKMAAVLLFAATQLNQFDVISTLVDQIVQNLTCINILIPYFVHTDNYMAVALILDAYSDKMSDFSILCACLYLCKHQNFNRSIIKFLDTLEDKYPEEVASIRITLLLYNQPANIMKDRVQECLDIIQRGKEKAPNCFQLLYNEAYLYAILGEKEKAFSLLKESLSYKPFDSRSILFMARILRSNSQPNAALALLKSISKKNTNKYIEIEKLYVLAESNKYHRIDKYIANLTNKYVNDIEVLCSIIRLNLMLSNKHKEAKAVLEQLSEIDKQTPEYYFCLAQIYIHEKDFVKAEKFLHSAIGIDPTNVEYLSALSIVFAKQGKNKLADERAKQALQIDQFSYYPWIAISNICTGDEKQRAIDKATQLRNSSINMQNIDLILFPEENTIIVTKHIQK